MNPAETVEAKGRCDVRVRVTQETLEDDFSRLYREGTDFAILEWDSCRAVATVRVFNEDMLIVRR